jgi:hypothetical protein
MNGKRGHAPLTRLGTYPPSHPTRASVADRVLGSVVARLVSRVPEIPPRARKDEPAAAGAPHLPAGDEGSEPLPQRSVCAAVAALRRAPTTTRALELLGLAARARPAQGDDLPVPADTGERAHVDAARHPASAGGSCERTGFGEAERRTSSAAGILTVCRAPPN